MLGYIPGVGQVLQSALRGGADIGASTLTIFYTLHTTVVPVLLVVLLPWHFWRVRRAKGVVTPAPEEEKPEQVLFVPNLLMREFAVAMALIAFVLVYSFVFDAQLGAPANQGMSPNPAKAPWYFLGLQELLLHFHPLFAVVVIPTLAVGALVLLPYKRFDSELAGNWFLSPRGRTMTVIAALTALVVTPIWVVLDEFVIDLQVLLPGVPSWVSNGLLPLSIILGLLFAGHRYIKKRYDAPNNESILALFAFLTVALVVLTATGIWFRGTGMALSWPWAN
jgi:quinol-cytochrome oxidoreductase complex cytochrome b subunit